MVLLEISRKAHVLLIKKIEENSYLALQNRIRNAVFIRDTTIVLIRIRGAHARCQIPGKYSLKAKTRHIYSLALLMASCCILYDAHTMYSRVFQKFQVAFAKVTSHVGKKLCNAEMFRRVSRCV